MKYFTPVIHVSGIDQAIKNIEICMNAKTHGVFLINHHLNAKRFIPIVSYIRKLFPDLWIGVNILGDEGNGEYPFTSIPELPRIQGYWLDNPRFVEDSEDQSDAKSIQILIKLNHPGVLYFGGVAFKYQEQPKDLEKMVKLSKNYLDVITTTGDRTGSPAEMEKIRRIHSAAGGHPIGIASGIDNDNIKEYIPYVDWFLVATGISVDEYNLDPVLVKKMSKTLSEL